MPHAVNPDRTTTPIFNGVGPNAWADLDTGIGMQAIVSILVICKSATTAHVSVRPVGSSSNTYSTSDSAAATATARAEQDIGVVLKCVTDSDGKIQWYPTGVGITFEVYLLGFDTANIVDPTAAGFPFTTDISTSWANKDISSIVGAGRSLVLAETKKNSGWSGHWAGFREDGDADNAITSTVVSRPGGCACWLHYSTSGYSYMPFFSVSGSGIFEAKRTTLSYVIDLYVHAYVDAAKGYVYTASTAYSTAAPPTSWTTLDLSSIVGSKAVEAYIKITRSTGGGGTLQRFAVRENGDTREYLATGNHKYGCQCGDIDEERALFLSVQTDTDGKIQWISDSAAYTVSVEVVGYIDAGGNPSVSNTTPEGTATELTKIGCTITDDFGMDTSTIVLTAKDAVGKVYTIYDGGNGGFQSGYGGVFHAPGSATTVMISVTEFPDFASPMLWTFSVSGDSISGASL